MTLARSLALALALAFLATPAAAEAPDAVLACEPPRTGPVVALPCSVSGHVGASFLVRIFYSAGDVGAVVVEATPDGSVFGELRETYRFVCPALATSALCVGPVALAPAYAGTWTFTARPAVADPGGSPFVRMEVTTS